MNTATALGLTVQLAADLDTAQKRVVAALKQEGFGVLTEIDVQATLKQKLGVEFRPYKILGACNPPLAYRALTAAPEVGLLLPCNVTLAETEPGRIEVSIVDPIAMLAGTGRPELAPTPALALRASAVQSVAEEARARLGRVAAALEE